MKKDISFVIAAYNTEQYIECCIDSILQQGLKSFEIIIVNDGSSDHTGEIAKKYEKLFENVKLIEQKNSGVSVARNAGLAVAQGEYICFVDSDDFFTEDSVAEMLRHCKKNQLDVIRGQYKILDDETGEYMPHEIVPLSYYGKTMIGEKYLCSSVDSKHIEVVPWLGLYRTSYLKNNGIDFPAGIGYTEDHLFFLRVLLGEGVRVMEIDKYIYVYRSRGGSATKTPSVKQAEDIASIVCKELEQIESKAFSKEGMSAALRYTSATYYQLTRIYGMISKSYRKKVWSLLSAEKKKLCLKNAYDRHQWIKLFLFNYFPGLVSYIYDRRK